jgi:GNAT superfamily N-acetyltransferase
MRMVRTFEIDPLGVHPDFRRRVLAHVLVLESFRRLRAIGVHLVYTASNFRNTTGQWLLRLTRAEQNLYRTHLDHALLSGGPLRVASLRLPFRLTSSTRCP